MKQSLHPFEKFSHWTLMIAINVSVAACQLPILQFCSFEKKKVYYVHRVLYPG